MANVMHHHIEFVPRPVSHAPSPFGFGFGLGQNNSATGWQPTSTPGHTNPQAFYQLASSMNQASSISSPFHRAQKRRLEVDDDVDSTATGKSSSHRDESMDRSPTPERPKRPPPKRVKTAPAEAASKEQNATKAGKAPESAEEDEVDVGVLLASLPPQALLPLLTALLKAQPSLKSTILPLIPRPTLETALQALSQAAKKLRDAYPYSNTPSSSQTSFGFGTRTPNATTSSHGGMRDAYVISRLRPHITEFTAACTSYLPYFSCIPTSKQPTSTSSQSQQVSFAQLHKDKSHPIETFTYLSAITQHIMDQPPLTQTSLVPLLLPRMNEEWDAWIDKLDDIVNRQGGLFGLETLRTWENALDDFADTKRFEGAVMMKGIRDKFVMKLGWLVNRIYQPAMDV